MGGCCCCASASSGLNRSQPLLHYPLPEAHDLLPSHIATSGALSTGLLVNTNLDISVPDTYQPPPPPIPYETYIGHPQTRSGNPEGSGYSSEVALETSNAVSVEGTNAGRTFETKVKNLVPDGKAEISSELEASKEMEDERSDELKKSSKPVIPPLQDDDDICPICLEEYDADNPKIMTRCDHHFHLACILEWMERSETCAMCDQLMVIGSVEGV